MRIMRLCINGSFLRMTTKQCRSIQEQAISWLEITSTARFEIKIFIHVDMLRPSLCLQRLLLDGTTYMAERFQAEFIFTTKDSPTTNKPFFSNMKK